MSANHGGDELLGICRNLLFLTVLSVCSITAAAPQSARQFRLFESDTPADLSPDPPCRLVLQPQLPIGDGELTLEQLLQVDKVAEGFLSGERSFDPETKQVFVPKGKRKKADHYMVIDYQGEPLVSFFRFEKQLTGAQVPRTFAAVFGVGVVTLKKIVPADLEARGISVEKALYQEKKLTAVLQQAGIGVAAHLATVHDRENFYVINTYEPGPSLNELYELHLQHKVSESYWLEAEKKHEDFVKKLDDLRGSEGFQKLVRDHKIDHTLAVTNDDVIYVDGQWKIVQF